MNTLIKTILTISISSILSCSPFSSPREIETSALINFALDYQLSLDSIESILVLTERGCPSCNRSFALFTKQHASHPNSINIISATGGQVDISPFFKAKDTYFDFNQNFQKTGLSEESCTIFLKEGRIDTIVKIQAQEIEGTFDYLAERLSN